jgi:hypothetical protein
VVDTGKERKKKKEEESLECCGSGRVRIGTDYDRYRWCGMILLPKSTQNRHIIA